MSSKKGKVIGKIKKKWKMYNGNKDLSEMKSTNGFELFENVFRL